MHVTKILYERRAAGLTQHEVARPLGMTAMNLSLAERGLISVTPEREQQILTLIRRLAKLNEVVAQQRQEIIEDLRVAR